MIDHVSFGVSNFKAGIAFYDATLSILQLERIITIDVVEARAAGYGNEKQRRPYFWISDRGQGPEQEQIANAKGVHVAFSAGSKEEVDRWYEACLKHGGKSNGEPGPRRHYHEGYYGAFIIDPDGWRIEACIHNLIP